MLRTQIFVCFKVRIYSEQQFHNDSVYHSMKEATAYKKLVHRGIVTGCQLVRSRRTVGQVSEAKALHQVQNKSGGESGLI